mgnify:CR=1 FL=1|tara:strand:+ start:666 stop:1868 length:1203 start_codon:yes stop_codon:yes gene_type:complete
MVKYSILIPSSNGGKYLYYAVKSVLNNKYDNCEVIVSLNNTTDKSDLKIRKLKDKRLKIIKTPKYFSMVKHYEWLIKKAKGDWVSIIGDDDGVVNNFFKKIDYILKKYESHDLQAISSSRAYYYWEGIEHIYGKTVVRYLDTEKMKIKNSKIELFKTLFGFSAYQNLPLLYTSGIVKKEILDQITSKSKNRFYNEPNPDVYSALAITLFTKKFLRVEKPLFWMGTSSKSNAVNLINDLSKKKLDIKNNIFLNHSQNDGYYLSKKIDPYFWQLRLRSGFLFSAFYQIPRNINKYYNNFFLDYMFCIFIITDFKTRRIPLTSLEREFLKKRIKNYISKKQINFLILKILSEFYLLFIRSFNFFEKITFRLKNFFYRYIFQKKFLYSKNRKKFPNILIANKHI